MGIFNIFGYNIEKMKHKGDIDGLVDALQKSNDFNIRKNAALALSDLHWIGSTDKEKAYHSIAQEKWDDLIPLRTAAIDPLIRTLQLPYFEKEGVIRDDQFWKIITHVFLELGTHAIEPLITALTIKAQRSQEILIHAIAMPSAKKVKYMSTIMMQSGLFSNFLEILIEFGEPSLIPLVKCLKNWSDQVRSFAVYAIGHINSKESLEPLVSQLTDSKKDVIAISLYAIGELKDKRAVPHLLSVLQKQDQHLSLFALSALVKIGDTTAIPEIRKTFSNFYPSHKDVGERAIEEMLL